MCSAMTVYHILTHIIHGVDTPSLYLKYKHGYLIPSGCSVPDQFGQKLLVILGMT